MSSWGKQSKPLFLLCPRQAAVFFEDNIRIAPR